MFVRKNITEIHKNKANVITSNYLEFNYIPLFDMYYDYYFQE